ncbi:AAA family ATPase [Clostridium neuense]|uniref:endopeptidase La n=1 Tax=Clostridium neuense TaxID=1728934 RepID=A0ABW8TGN2_9CLOT
MYRKLVPEDIIYSVKYSEDVLYDEEKVSNQDNEFYKSIKKGLNIKDRGYNIYIIDKFSKHKLESIVSYMDKILMNEHKPYDICYITFDNSKNVEGMIVPNGFGKKFFEQLNEVKKLYIKLTYKFYNDSDDMEHDKIIENVQKKKNYILSEIIDEAEKQGFQFKVTDGGFNFIPLKDGAGMTENEYETLGVDDKEVILDKIRELKKKTNIAFDKLKDIETDEINKLKGYFENYLISESEKIKMKFFAEFQGSKEIIDKLNKICSEIEHELVENYSMSYENDEAKILNAISKYYINVIVDNSKNEKPPIIYEDDPNIENLIGSIKYENHNGTYVTDISLIKAGSILKANGGCLIMRINNLLSYNGSYYYLKKILSSGKIKINYNRGYAEAVSLNGIVPDPIDVKLKVILIGDYYSYSLMYNYDKDFKDIFKIKAEYDPIFPIESEVENNLIRTLKDFCKSNKLKEPSKDAYKEIRKYMSRMAENNKKYYIDTDEIFKILTLSNLEASYEGGEEITENNIRKIIYNEDLIEEKIMEDYKEKKILMEVSGRKIGQINGLSVIDLGYCTFGKPMKITCSCYKGDGNIIDVNKENDLSGSIHCKSISILKGFINKTFGMYSKIPIDFHLSFEQLYGKLDGDSASVAETVCILSALSKIPIKQNIAVTGSINQFGETQPIGGVNHKIEGFYKVCEAYNKDEEHGVLIPETNIDNIVLNNEVEAAVLSNKFSIYSMNNISDAVNVLMEVEWEDMMKAAKNELKKYVTKREKH